MIKSSSRRMPLEWRQLGIDVPFCKPTCYEEPLISWDLLSHSLSSKKPSLIKPWCSLLPSLMYSRKWEGTVTQEDFQDLESKEVGKQSLARCWCWSRQEERASGNSPASSGALQMKQSQEPQGSSCQWHSPPPPFLPAWLHGCGGGELEKWRG